MKPGWKTTEFWMTTIAGLLGILVALGIVGPETEADIIKMVGMMVPLILGAIYTLSRGIAKRNNSG